MERIVLVHTPVSELQEDRLEPPLGLLYLATYLKHHNIDVSIVDLCGKQESDWDIPYSEYYGFSTYTANYHRTVEIRKLLHPKAITIAGGPHASALPDEVSRDFDYVIVGEGEIALLNLLRGQSGQSTHFRPFKCGKLVTDLNELPYPDYSLVDMLSYKRVVAGKQSFSILSSRGCPFKCLFCNSNIMGGHKQARFRSPKNVISEIKSILNNYGDVAFRFQDDIFGLNRHWLKEFTNLVKPLDITYRAFVRSNQCANDGFTDLLYEGGCRHIAIGIESGSNKILRLMQKGQTVEHCINGIANAKKSGLIIRIYLIVGFPGETWDTIKKTVDFVKKVKPNEFVVYPFIPYPGTLLYNCPEKYGLRNIDKDFTKYFQIYGDKQSHFVYDLDNVDRYELQAMKDYVVAELEKIKVLWAKDSDGYV